MKRRRRRKTSSALFVLRHKNVRTAHSAQLSAPLPAAHFRLPSFPVSSRFRTKNTVASSPVRSPAPPPKRTFAQADIAGLFALFPNGGVPHRPRTCGRNRAGGHKKTISSDIPESFAPTPVFLGTYGKSGILFRKDSAPDWTPCPSASACTLPDADRTPTQKVFVPEEHTRSGTLPAPRCPRA